MKPNTAHVLLALCILCGCDDSVHRFDTPDLPGCKENSYICMDHKYYECSEEEKGQLNYVLTDDTTRNCVDRTVCATNQLMLNDNCIDCEEDQLFDLKAGKCISRCTDNQLYDFETKKCVDKKQCEEGKFLNTQTNECILTCEEEYYYIKTNKQGEKECVPVDANNNHMKDGEELTEDNYKPCKTHSDCKSGFCDSFIGYKCSKKCTSDEQYVNNETDDYHYICRNDGRCAPDSFITIWRFNDDVTKEASFLMRECKSFTVDWGDGKKEDLNCDALQGTLTVDEPKPTNDHFYKFERIVANKDNSKETVIRLSHDYPAEGEYTVKITSKSKEKFVIAIDYDGTTAKKNFWGVLAFGPAGIGKKSFCYITNDFSISEIDIPDASIFTSASGIFWGSGSFNRSLSNWDVSNVKDMSHMFRDTAAFNQSLDSWDVSSVEDMSRMFQSAAVFNQSLSNWDVSNVKDMSIMFRKAAAFNQSLSNWDVSKVTTFNEMFYGAKSFDQDISKWNWNVNPEASARYMLTGSKLDNPAKDECNEINGKHLDETLKGIWGENFAKVCHLPN